MSRQARWSDRIIWTVFFGHSHSFGSILFPNFWLINSSEIEGENNPTLLLEEGEDYTIEWINADGVNHDLQIWDESDDLVDDLATDSIDAERERERERLA